MFCSIWFEWLILICWFMALTYFCLGTNGVYTDQGDTILTHAANCSLWPWRHLKTVNQPSSIEGWRKNSDAWYQFKVRFRIPPAAEGTRGTGYCWKQDDIVPSRLELRFIEEQMVPRGSSSLAVSPQIICILAFWLLKNILSVTAFTVQVNR